jgi:GNAT superfamily N-acetyltransferase
MIKHGDLSGLEGHELDRLIARQVRVFAERREGFEWKLHGHDRPPDLPERLGAAGLVPEDPETVVIARVGAIKTDLDAPAEILVHEVSARVDLERIAELEEAVWKQNEGWQVDLLLAERAADPDSVSIFVAEADGRVVSAGWVRFPRGTEFATLWGGATLPEWRRRGIYRALVARRAQVAVQRRCRSIQVDASDQSRPILERLGFVAVTTTTPFVWSPPVAV